MHKCPMLACLSLLMCTCNFLKPMTRIWQDTQRTYSSADNPPFQLAMQAPPPSLVHWFYHHHSISPPIHVQQSPRQAKLVHLSYQSWNITLENATAAVLAYTGPAVVVVVARAEAV